MRSKAQEAQRLSSVRVVNHGYLSSERLRSQTTIGPKAAMVSTSGVVIGPDLEGDRLHSKAGRKIGLPTKVHHHGRLLSMGSSVSQAEALKRKLRFLQKQLTRKRTDSQRHTLEALIVRTQDTIADLLAKVAQASLKADSLDPDANYRNRMNSF